MHRFPKVALRWWCRPPGSDKGAVCLQLESVDLDALTAARELYLTALRAAIDGLRAAGVTVDDAAFEHGRWRHAARFVRARSDLTPPEIPQGLDIE